MNREQTKFELMKMSNAELAALHNVLTMGKRMVGQVGESNPHLLAVADELLVERGAVNEPAKMEGRLLNPVKSWEGRVVTNWA